MTTDEASFIYHQSAVIPYRRVADRLELMLITNRKGKRWVIPKGLLEPHLTPAESAAQEALEEAGIVGRISPTSVGTYSYKKWGGVCHVEVYLLAVEQELPTWAEDFRQRRWFTIEEASSRVRETDLKMILQQLPHLIGTEADVGNEG